jgi:hypothetical protein
MDFTQLEKDTLAWFVSHNDSDALKQQCETATVLKREHTGVGLFVELSCPSNCAPVEYGCTPNAPHLISPQLQHGASADLWFESGRISYIEFVAHGGSHFPKSSFPYKLVGAL